MERASNDLRSVVTTYEGKHSHDVPGPRGSGSYTGNRPLSDNSETSGPTVTGPISMVAQANTTTNYANHFSSTRVPTTTTEQGPITPEMLQSKGNYGFSGFGNSPKEEPEDNTFLDSFLR